MNDNSQTEEFPPNLDVANLSDAFSQDQLDKLNRLGITNLNQMLQISFGKLMAAGLNLIEIDNLQQQVDIVIKKKNIEIKCSDKLASKNDTQASFTNSEINDKGFIKLDYTQNLKDYQLNFDSNDSFDDEDEQRLVIDETPKPSIVDLPPDIPLTSNYDMSPPKKNKTTANLRSSSKNTSTAPIVTTGSSSQGLKKSASGSIESNKRTHPYASDRKAAKKKAVEQVSTTQDINLTKMSENKTDFSAELAHMNFRQLLLKDIPPDIWDVFYRDFGHTATSIPSSATNRFSAQRNLTAHELNKPVYCSTEVSKASHTYRVGRSAAAFKPSTQRFVTTTRMPESKKNSSLDPAYINFRKLLLGAKLPVAQVRAGFYHEISDDSKDENAKSGGEGDLHTTVTTVSETPQQASENKSLAARKAELINTHDPPKLKCGNRKSSLKSELTTTSVPPPTSVSNATSTSKPPPKSESNVMSSSKPKSKRKAKSTSMDPPPSVRNAPSTSMSPPTSVFNVTSTAKPPPKSERNGMSTAKPLSERNATFTSMDPPPSMRKATSISKPLPKSERMSTAKPLSEHNPTPTSMGPPPASLFKASSKKMPPLRRMSNTKELVSSTGGRSDLQYDPRRAANPTTGIGLNSQKNCAGLTKFSEIYNLLIASDWYNDLGSKNKLPINHELLTVKDELIKFHQFKQSRKFDAGFIKSNETLIQIFGKLHINIDENGQVVQLPKDGSAGCSGSSGLGESQHFKLPDMSQPPPNLRGSMVLGPFNKPPPKRKRRATMCK